MSLTCLLRCAPLQASKWKVWLAGVADRMLMRAINKDLWLSLKVRGKRALSAKQAAPQPVAPASIPCLRDVVAPWQLPCAIIGITCDCDDAPARGLALMAAALSTRCALPHDLQACGILLWKNDINEKVVEMWKERGLKVIAWTVNNQADKERLASLGVPCMTDVLTTEDAPEQAD